MTINIPVSIGAGIIIFIIEYILFPRMARTTTQRLSDDGRKIYTETVVNGPALLVYTALLTIAASSACFIMNGFHWLPSIGLSVLAIIPADLFIAMGFCYQKSRNPSDTEYNRGFYLTSVINMLMSSVCGVIILNTMNML